MKFSQVHVLAILAFVAHLGSSAPVHFGVSKLFAQSAAAPKARKCCCCCKKAAAAAPTNANPSGDGWRTPGHGDSCPIPGGCAACNAAKTVGLPVGAEHVVPDVAL